MVLRQERRGSWRLAALAPSVDQRQASADGEVVIVSCCPVKEIKRLLTPEGRKLLDEFIDRAKLDTDLVNDLLKIVEDVIERYLDISDQHGRWE